MCLLLVSTYLYILVFVEASLANHHPRCLTCFFSKAEQFGATLQPRAKFKKEVDICYFPLLLYPQLNLALVNKIRGGNASSDENRLANDPPPTDIRKSLIDFNNLLVELLGREADVIASLLDQYRTYKEVETALEKRNCFARIMEDVVVEIRSQISYLTNVTFTSVDDYASRVLSSMYKVYAEFLNGQKEFAIDSKCFRCGSFLREQASIIQDIEDYLEGGGDGLSEAVLCSVLVGCYKKRVSTLSSQASEYIMVIMGTMKEKCMAGIVVNFFVKLNYWLKSNLFFNRLHKHVHQHYPNVSLPKANSQYHPCISSCT
mmetsp:Transcript_5315/g.7862  ORF Transcript_5315/g.7862 Transcript_5315/m.7862 type:complete len:317 (-) Transcript_5315:697-1647(-)